ncbi:hypothetical protein WMF28_33540 [Sorangium sp. So ce590]|uniref:hypothetical protein n=1 Tax=Sorangium sp. So ce590 TaxID=3133317 RepID=UPI003F648575
MKQTLKLGVSVIAIAVAVVGVVQFLVDRSPKHREREYRVTVAEPTRGARAPERHAAPARPPHRELAPEPTAEPESPAAERAADVEPAAPEPEDQVAHVEALYSGEPVDRSWAASAEQRLDEGLRSYFGKGSRMLSVDCRTSLCKVNVSHQGLSEQIAFVEQAFRANDYWPGARMAWRQQNPDGSVTSELYFVKDGEPLPQLN